MRKITHDERQDLAPVLSAVCRTPAFHVARLWIEQSNPVRARAGCPTPVGAVCFALQHTWGAVVSSRVMALALEQSGFRIGVRNFVRFGDGNRELAVNIRRGSINENCWRTEMPDPERWSWVSTTPPVSGAERLYRNLFDWH